MRVDAVIFGSGGFAREIYSLLQDIDCEVRGFLAPDEPDGPALPAPYLGGDVLAPKLALEGVKVAYLAIGDMNAREKVFGIAQMAGLRCPPLIHPKAVFLAKEPPGEATIIYPGVLVMTGCRIGKGVLLNAGCTLGHDTEIGEFSNVNPGAHLAGFVRVGEKSFIGIGSSIVERIVVGANAVIGAGSVVVRDVPPGVTAYGVPAHGKCTG